MWFWNVERLINLPSNGNKSMRLKLYNLADKGTLDTYMLL